MIMRGSTFCLLQRKTSEKYATRQQQDQPAAALTLPAKQLLKTMETSSSTAPNHGGSQMRVAYQGVAGAFSEAAAREAYANCHALVPCNQFEAAFQAVEQCIADRAVLPLENSLGGSIHKNYDLLLRHRLHIVGEVHLHVHHCLVALHGTQIDDVARVISHPQALSQCERTLTKLLPAATCEAVENTAMAAKQIAANNLHDTAAIASARAAELYGLKVVADGVQDDSRNVTRFIVLAREPIVPLDQGCRFKTSIVFAPTENGNGDVLFKVMSAFVSRKISLTKIESRPYRDRPVSLVDNGGPRRYFDYVFYVDFEASIVDVGAQNALADARKFTSFLRVLGSYPMASENTP